MVLEKTKKKKQRAELVKLSQGKRLPGAGRKPKVPAIEELLAAWIYEDRSKNLYITKSVVQSKALELQYTRVRRTSMQVHLEVG